jgi:hypothetical protein
MSWQSAAGSASASSLRSLKRAIAFARRLSRVKIFRANSFHRGSGNLQIPQLAFQM